MSRHRDFRKLNIDEELDDDALSDGGEEPMTEEQENELYDALERVRAIIGNAQASGISDKELKDCLWQEYNDVNRAVEWALAEQGRKRVALERKDSALEYFRSRNLDANDDQSRIPKIILAQQQAFEQGEGHDTYAQPDHPNLSSEDPDSTFFGPYRPELSTITERSEVTTQSSHRALRLLEHRREGDSSRTTSYGEIIQDDSQTQRFFANAMGEETPRQHTKSLPRSSVPDASLPSIRVSSATTLQTPNSSMPAEKPLPNRPPSLASKKSKLSSLASSRLSSAASALSASSRDDGTALTGSVKTFPELRPSPQSEMSITPSVQPTSMTPQTSLGDFAASTPSSPRSQATGVSEMSAHVQKAIQAALQLEEIDKVDIKPERPRLTLAQPQSPSPAKGVPLRSLQAVSELAAQQSPQLTTPQHQRPTSGLSNSSSTPKSTSSTPVASKPHISTHMEEVKSDASSGKPMSKLAKLAQQKVTASKAPKLPPSKTEYLVPTANGGTATTAITTSYQSFFSLTDPKRPSYVPRLDVVPIATTSAVQPARTSKLALKVKKAGEKPAVKSAVEESLDTTSPPVSPIFQSTTRSRAPPSAFASVLVREDLVMYKPSRRSKERPSDRRSLTEELEARHTSKNEAMVPNLVPSSGFAFDSLSPDDLVFNARRGTALSQTKSGKSSATSTLSSRT